LKKISFSLSKLFYIFKNSHTCVTIFEILPFKSPIIKAFFKSQTTKQMIFEKSPSSNPFSSPNFQKNISAGIHF